MCLTIKLNEKLTRKSFKIFADGGSGRYSAPLYATKVFSIFDQSSCGKYKKAAIYGYCQEKFKYKFDKSNNNSVTFSPKTQAIDVSNFFHIAGRETPNGNYRSVYIKGLGYHVKYADLQRDYTYYCDDNYDIATFVKFNASDVQLMGDREIIVDTFSIVTDIDLIKRCAKAYKVKLPKDDTLLRVTERLDKIICA